MIRYISTYGRLIEDLPVKVHPLFWLLLPHTFKGSLDENYTCLGSLPCVITSVSTGQHSQMKLSESSLSCRVSLYIYIHLYNHTWRKNQRRRQPKIILDEANFSFDFGLILANLRHSPIKTATSCQHADTFPCVIYT